MAKRATKTPTATPRPPLVFPGNLIPLDVYGAWKEGHWSSLSDGAEFDVSHGRVRCRSSRYGESAREYDIGPLPNGWGYVYLQHRQTGSSGYFVGPKWACEVAKAVQSRVDTAEDELDRLLHGDGVAVEDE